MSAAARGKPAPAVKEGGTAAYGRAPMENESTRLMLAVKRGDALAFDALVAAVRTRAFHVARSLVGSRDDALDLSQEALLKVYRARESFCEGEAFLPWFHRILRNTCFSFLRDTRRGRTRSVSAHAPDADGDEADLELVEDGPGPTERIEADERARAFWRRFATLPARDREILALRHFQELSYREIATTLAIPEGTVMSRLFHARRRLRDALAADFGDELAGVESVQPKALR